MRTKMIRALRKEGVYQFQVHRYPTRKLVGLWLFLKIERARDAVDWEYVGRWAAGVILVLGMAYLAIYLTISNLQIGS